MTAQSMRIVTRWAFSLAAMIFILAAVPGSAWGNQHSKNDNLYKISVFGFSQDDSNIWGNLG